ncbi:MAG: GAF domain-containing protein [Cytophagales bacterium]|nr:MAG: GAF domain-containing protein [Cytophagales bacterium]
MISPRSALLIFVYANIASWLLVLFFNFTNLIGLSDRPLFDIDLHLNGLLINFFFLLVFFYFKRENEKQRDFNFIDVLTSLFIKGLSINTIALFLQYISTQIEMNPPHTEFTSNSANVLYHANIILLTIFITDAFFAWKRMILYQHSQRAEKLWLVWEYLLLVSLIFNFFEFDFSNTAFALTVVGMLLLAFVISLNQQWVAYLNTKEKWQSILLLLFIGGFGVFFFRTVIIHAEKPYLTTNLLQSAYVILMIGFVILFAFFSILVIIFNLPTTSAFERKTEEIVSFQKLVQSFNSGFQEEYLYQTLLNTSVDMVEADAAWIDIVNEQKKKSYFIRHQISIDQTNELKKVLKSNQLSRIINNTFQGNKKEEVSLEDVLRSFGYGSLLTVPLSVHGQNFGILNLLKKQKNAFDVRTKQLVNTFALQTSLAIENFRLLARTIATERYKEEIEIAQKVQKSLLPSLPTLHPSLELTAFSYSAYEVGGDYYDAFMLDDSRIFLLIADVSGKGTTAAFNMAQMKGIFQALMQMQLNTGAFLSYANDALSVCLDKNSFVTATAVIINTETKTIEITRAGHCPTLYYNHKEQAWAYLRQQGLGLGIVRKNNYSTMLSTDHLSFLPEDLLILYTDGIIEAKNEQKEEYGYERLQQIMEKNKHLPVKDMEEALIKDLNTFTGNMPAFDDHTGVIVRFKNGL